MVKDIPIIYSRVNLSIDIETKYSFCRYYYLKHKVVLLLSLPTNKICFNIGCLVTLYDITFFENQAPDILIWKMAIPIIVWGLQTNRHITN